MGGWRGGGRKLGVALLIAGGCQAAAPARVPCDPASGVMVERAPFTRIAVDEDASGAAFVTAADLNGDGRTDLLVSRFGDFVQDGAALTLSPARLELETQGESLGCWHRTTLIDPAEGLFFINQVTTADVDGDGDLDLIVPAGFFVCGFDPAVKSCGALVWLENDHGNFRRHDLLGPGERFFTHAEWADLDGDGVRDLVTVGETASGGHLLMLRGDRSADRFAHEPVELSPGMGSFPQVVDADGDGDLDVVSAEYFVQGSSFAWAENRSGSFVRHVLAADRGKGFQLALVPNLYGDGVTRAVGTNHTNTNGDASAVESAVFALDRPDDPTGPWPSRALSAGIRSRPSQGAAVLGAPGVFGWGDIDGDGDLDLAVAGDGDARTFWLEQTDPGSFATHVIEDELGQASGALVVDLDGDGADELVFSGYERGAVYLYRREVRP